jgi:hypothetical protein
MPMGFGARVTHQVEDWVLLVSLCLLLSIVMQFTGVQVSTLAAEIFSFAILLVASLARGYGFA